MHGYRFFEEFTNESQAQSAGNVIAIRIGSDSFVQEGGVCLSALCAERDVGQSSGAVFTRLFNAEYLGTHCRIVSEERARAMQPKLFEYLDTIA
jgi:hypothetical protein